MRKRQTSGQVLLLFLTALGIFLLGAVGFAIDASFLYTHRQLAQAAADAAAEAGIMSIFNNTNTSDFGNAFGTASFDCLPPNNVLTPCVYAQYHGFGDDANETVLVDFPETVDGVALSDDDDPAAIGVTVTRTVDTGLVRFLGTSLATVRARAIAVITDVFSPVPIIVLHPTLGDSGTGAPKAAFDKNGSNVVRICGGPTKSIQVNSRDPLAIRVAGDGGSVDLSKAGPKNWAGPNSCAGEGADFGAFGGPPTFPGVLQLGTDGEYNQPASPIRDPLLDVAEPTAPATNGTVSNRPGGTPGCPLPASRNCKVYTPGLYPSGFSTAVQEFAILQPGLYYIQNGNFNIGPNSAVQMDSTAACTLPDFGCGVVVFIEGNGGFLFSANSGKVQGVSYSYTFPNGTVCTGNCLLGSEPDGIYKSILFFKDRESDAQRHELWGSADLTIQGTIYLTNTEETMLADEDHYQWLALGGTGGGNTRILGMIIVDRLELSGNALIEMTLDPNASLNIRQIALVR